MNANRAVTSRASDLDYARRLLGEPQDLTAAVEALTADHGAKAGCASDGVSVIIPSYHSGTTLRECLDSIYSQSLARDLYEVIVVINGPSANNSSETANELQDRYQGLDLRVLSTARASAGYARNIGLAAARREYVTFVDDDDRVAPDFLRLLLEAARPDAIAVATIADSRAQECDVSWGALAKRIADIAPQDSVAIADQPWLLGFNACKIVPRALLAGAEYDTELTSGEDVVFFAHLLAVRDLRAYIVEPSERGAYLRTIRQGSVSRQDDSFEFSVLDRLAVIKRLLEMDVHGEPGTKAIQQLVSAQAGFVQRYLVTHPEQRDRVAAAIRQRVPFGFPWRMLRTESVKDLAICYCFAPYMDTSAVVAAKVIADRRKVVDVISNNMSPARSRDKALGGIVEEWIAERIEIDTRPAFSDWALISEFADAALKRAELQNAVRGGYKTLYSRALWVGSHVAAARFKLRHWGTAWTAEFSDPLRRGVDGSARQGALNGNATEQELVRALSRRGYATDKIATLFDLVELATYALADELVFTNENQRDAMLGAVEDKKLSAAALAKSVVRRHPSPPAHAYDLVSSTYVLPPAVRNIAYFGAFYKNRGIDEVMVAIANLASRERSQIRLHVFSNSNEEVSARALELGVASNVHSNGYRPYPEFLNLASRFDVLIVNDVTMPPGEKNPFLPSKLSDYRGSGVPIWALTEEGSPLDAEDVAYKSRVGDSRGAVSVLTDIALRRKVSSRGH